MPDALPLLPGDPAALGGHRLLGRLGEGGQGVVFLGRDASGEHVAIKLLHARMAEDPEARDRFVRELAAAKKVARFCTAQVLDADVAGDRPYIVSEYVEGRSLRSHITAEGPRGGGALERLAISTLTALAAIHKAGVVHRDFTPHNVLLGPDGPRVIDFGIARALGAARNAETDTVGTPAYMAPEQIAGGEIGPPADMFAWGSTIVCAATGRPPFGNESVSAVMDRIVHADPDVSALPEPLRSVVAACLTKDPAQRPTAQQAQARLLDHEPSTPPPPPPSFGTANTTTTDTSTPRTATPTRETATPVHGPTTPTPGSAAHPHEPATHPHAPTAHLRGPAIPTPAPTALAPTPAPPAPGSAANPHGPATPAPAPPLPGWVAHPYEPAAHPHGSTVPAPGSAVSAPALTAHSHGSAALPPGTGVSGADSGIAEPVFPGASAPVDGRGSGVPGFVASPAAPFVADGLSVTGAGSSPVPGWAGARRLVSGRVGWGILAGAAVVVAGVTLAVPLWPSGGDAATPPRARAVALSPTPTPTLTPALGRPRLNGVRSGSPIPTKSPVHAKASCRAYDRVYGIGGLGSVLLKASICPGVYSGTVVLLDTAPKDGWDVCAQLRGHVAGSPPTFVSSAIQTSKDGGVHEVENGPDIRFGPKNTRTMDWVRVHYGKCRGSGTSAKSTWTGGDRLTPGRPRKETPR